MKYEALDYIVKIVQIIGFLSLVFTVIFGYYRYKHYLESTKKFALDAVHKSNSRYDKIMLELARNYTLKDIVNLKGRSKILFTLYLDLCEEQLYYISEKLVDEKIAKIWIGKMNYLLRMNNGSGKREIVNLFDLDSQVVEEMLTSRIFVLQYFSRLEAGSKKDDLKESSPALQHTD